MSVWNKKVIEIGRGLRPCEGWGVELELSANGNVARHELLIGSEWDSELVRLLQKAAVTMTVGERAVFDGSVDVTLLKAEKKGKAAWEMSNDERVEAAHREKARGGELYKEGRFTDAFYRFQRALRLLAFSGAPADPLKPVFCDTMSNITLCHVKANRLDDVVASSSKVISLDPTRVKSLYQRAVAYVSLRDFTRAHIDLLAVLNLQPDHGPSLRQLKLVESELRRQESKYSEMVKRMFS